MTIGARTSRPETFLEQVQRKVLIYHLQDNRLAIADRIFILEQSAEWAQSEARRLSAGNRAAELATTLTDAADATAAAERSLRTAFEKLESAKDLYVDACGSSSSFAKAAHITAFRDLCENLQSEAKVVAALAESFRAQVPSILERVAQAADEESF